MAAINIMKKSLAACLNFRSGITNSPKTELMQLEVIDGRSVSSYLPVNFEGSIPDFFRERAGHELGGPSDVSWVSNIYMKDGVFYGSGFIPVIRGGGLIEARDSFSDLEIKKLKVDKIINEPTFLITSHLSAHNFYHFMIDYLPRLLVMKKSKRENAPFLFSSYRTGFQYQAMELLLSQICPIHNASAGILLRDCAVMSSVTKVDAVDFLRERSAHILANNSIKRIYISRRYALVRRVVNESDLEPILRKFGFQIIENENINLATQISLFKAAEFICAPHGAGLANISYCKKQTSVLEIIMEPRFPLGGLFWELACAAELDYHVLGATRIPVHEADLTDGDMYIDPEKFEAALGYMVEQKK